MAWQEPIEECPFAKDNRWNFCLYISSKSDFLWAVAGLVGTIQRASSETCNVHGLTFMNWAVRGG
jgi:hypothetical protein